MNKSLLYFLIILLIGWIILGAWLCCKFLCTDCIAPKEEVKEKSAWLWSLKDGTQFNAGANDHFDFIQSKYNNLPIASNLSLLVDSTARYLQRTPNRSLVITGQYDTTETNSSILPSLGLARAEQVKRLFVAKGVNPAQLVTEDRVKNLGFSTGDTLFRGVDFDFNTFRAIGDTRLADIKSNLIGKPITLYFQTGQSNVSLTSNQRKLFSDIIYYLDNVNTSKISVTGYTDNIGSLSTNKELSLGRADFIKKYLAQNGIPNTRMNTDGRGPGNPIASNSNPEGRAQNRRVEVILN